VNRKTSQCDFANRTESQTSLYENENENENEYENVSEIIFTRIDDEVAKLKTQESWLDNLQVQHHMPAAQLVQWLDAFALDCKADGKECHVNLADAMSHFNRWLGRKTQSNNGRQQQATIDRRSRTNISPGEVKNYSSGF
jgi:hypothetical protein